MRIAEVQAEDWSEPALAEVVPLRRRSRVPAVVLELAILSALTMGGLAIARSIAHRLSPNSGCCAGATTSR